jgi:hypothetical protein
LRDPTEIHVTNIRFLGEQDGEPERLLKARLIDLLKQHNHIQRAYLARVAAAEQANVALCLRSLTRADRNLVQEIGSIFAAIFVVHEHLDILFLNETQESALAAVCAPFYSRA